MIYWVVSLLVFAAACVFSMLGLGGALLYIPLFKWFGFDFKAVAIPTGLFLNGITALSAAVYYFRAGMVDVRGAIPMALATLIGAPLGAHLTCYVSTEKLVLLFALFVLFVGLRMLFVSGQPEPKEFLPYTRRIIIASIASFLIGFLAGFLGVGGGSLFVPLLIALGYPTKQAAATCSLIVVFSSFAGFSGHVAEGHFDLKLLLFTTVAVIAGSQLGARLMRHKMKAKWIKRLFGLVLLLVALKLGLKVLLK